MENETGNAIVDKSFSFAVRIVKLHKFLVESHKAFSLGDQLLRAGTSIGANVAEAQDAQSKKDFTAKLSIALKEARETKYWIQLLIASDYLDRHQPHVASLLDDMEEIIKLLVTIIKRSKEAPA
ncbi:four helix bundle protein [Hydrogenimonas sp.]